MYGEYKKYITIMGLVKPVLRLIQGKIFPGMSANSFSTFEKFSAHYSFPRTSQRTGFPLFHTRNLQPPARPEHAIFNGSRDASEKNSETRLDKDMTCSIIQFSRRIQTDLFKKDGI